MELAGQNVPPLEGRDEAPTVFRPCGRPALGAGSPTKRVGEVGVSRPQKRAAGVWLDAVPTQLRYAQPRSALDVIREARGGAWHDPESARSGALLARFSEQLQSQADCQCRSIGLDAGTQGIIERLPPELRARGSEGADSGQDHVGGACYLACRIGEARLGAEPPQRREHGGEIGRASTEDEYLGRG